jgi:hypothetical protein
MGFKSSSGAVAQTTRFKRKLYSPSSQNYRNSCSNLVTSPPATPFNNTSFLIQLQQRREQGGSTPAFDQYGSMEKMIACCSGFASRASTSPTTSPRLHRPPISAPSGFQSGNLSISQITDPELSPQLNYNSDGSQVCDSGPQQLHSCSDGASSGIRPKVEADEGDGMQRHRHRQCFMDDNFDTQLCTDSGSQTGSSMRK